MRLFHLSVVEQSTRVYQGRLDILFFKLLISLDNIIPRLSAGDLV
jgi:hypothetical protein